MTDTILELFKRRVNECGPRPALLRKIDGAWEQQSWKEWWEQSERLAAGLMQRGLEPGGAVAILSNTRIEWVWVDMAVTMAGGVVVPIYPSTLPDQCRHILDDSQARFVCVEDASQLDKIAEVYAEVPTLQEAIYLERDAVRSSPDWKGRRQVRLDDIIEAHGRLDWVVGFDEVVAVGRGRMADDHRLVADRRQAIDAHDLATIIYTSGTSGPPKGVEHTHATLAAEVDALDQLALLSAQDRQLLFLPLAHIFAKILFLSAIATGVETAFAQDLARVMANLQEVKPTYFAAVPRIFEKIYAQVIADIPPADGPAEVLRDRAMGRAKYLSRRRQRGDSLGWLARLETRVYRTLVLGRVQRLFGGNIRFLFCGGARLDADLAEFFHAAGILILEGYGLTETAAVSTLNLPDDFAFGSVGKPVPGADLTIAEDGEILVRGPMVMTAYHGLPDETAQAIEADKKWLHTGDMGRFDRDGFLYITGRKSHLLVTSGGKNIAPEPIESALRELGWIKQAVVCGDGRRFVTALLTLDEPAETWAIQQGMAFDGRADLATSARVYARVGQLVASVNRELPHFKAIRQFALLVEPLTVEDGHLTPTGKLRRAAIIERFRPRLDALYEPDAPQKN